VVAGVDLTFKDVGFFVGLPVSLALLAVISLFVAATTVGLNLLSKSRWDEALATLVIAAVLLLIFILTTPPAVILIQKMVCN
jgi:hypothetical protein